MAGRPEKPHDGKAAAMAAGLAFLFAVAIGAAVILTTGRRAPEPAREAVAVPEPVKPAAPVKEEPVASDRMLTVRETPPAEDKTPVAAAAPAAKAAAPAANEEKDWRKHLNTKLRHYSVHGPAETWGPSYIPPNPSK